MPLLDGGPFVSKATSTSFQATRDICAHHQPVARNEGRGSFVPNATPPSLVLSNEQRLRSPPPPCCSRRGQRVFQCAQRNHPSFRATSNVCAHHHHPCLHTTTRHPTRSHHLSFSTTIHQKRHVRTCHCPLAPSTFCVERRQGLGDYCMSPSLLCHAHFTHLK